MLFTQNIKRRLELAKTKKKDEEKCIATTKTEQKIYLIKRKSEKIFFFHLTKK